MGLLLFTRRIRVAQIVFRLFFFFSLEEVVPYIAAYSVCPWEKVSPGSSYSRHLKLESPPQNSYFCIFMSCVLMAQLVLSLSSQLLWDLDVIVQIA